MTDTRQRTHRAPAGREAVALLARVVAEAKAGDPLAPVTVLAPSNGATLALRRLIGSGAVTADGTGLFNVRFVTGRELIALLAGPALAAEGRKPLPEAVAAEAVRLSLMAEPGSFEPVTDHPSTERLLEQTFADLRAVSPQALDRVAAESPRAADVVRLHRAVRHRLAERWYDDHDLLQQAVAVARGSVPHHGALHDLGRLVVYAARDTDQVARELIEAFGARVEVVEASVDPAPTGTRVITTSDDDDEARAVAREVLALARRGIPLHRVAVAHPGAGYPRLLHQHLEAAGIAHHGTGVRTLADTVPGATLLGALDLPDQDFRRDAVMAWFAAAPIIDPASETEVHSARWDRISARAGVVSGARHWHDRLERRRLELQDQIAVLRAEGDDDGAERRERDIVHLDELEAFVTSLIEELSSADRPRAWSAHVAWAKKLLDHHLGGPGHRVRWPDRDQAAWDQVHAVLDGLSALDAMGEHPDLATFRRAVERDLTRPAERLGTFGQGVMLATIPALRGIDVDAVIVVGLAEGMWPGRAHDHPLLPDRERRAAGGELDRPDPLQDQHDALLHAVAAGRTHRILTFPRAALSSGREQLPSRWLLHTASHLAGERVTSVSLADTDAHPGAGIERVGSFVAGITGSEPVSLAERDLAGLYRWTRAGGDALHHPLAGERPRLRAGWTAAQARRTGGFGPYEGQVDPRHIQGVDPEHPLSATSLEKYAKCPRDYFLDKVLGIRSQERPEEIDQISGADRGTLVHRILERYIREVVDHDAPRVLDRLQELAEEEFAEVEARGITGRPLRWAYDKQVIHRELIGFHSRDHLQPVAAELSFGVDDETPVSVQLPNDRRVSFKGNADRVDRDPRSGSLVVTDYKTGKKDEFKKLPETLVARGTKLQLPIYGLAARAAHGSPDTPVRTRYWFTSERGQFVEIGYELDQRVLDVFAKVLDVIVTGIGSGHFPAHPGAVTNWPNDGTYENCRYCDFHQVCPTDRGRAWARVSQNDGGELSRFVALVEGPDPAAEPEPEQGDGEAS